MDNQTIKFALPTLWNHWDFTVALIKFQEMYPEAFRPNATIGAVYDNFPYCLWDGGRIFNEYTYASIEDITIRKEFLETHGIPLRLIFTSPVIQEQHLYDRFCNLVTQVCENDINEIVVNSEILENYLREHYPKYSFISSTTKCNVFDASLKEVETNKYKYICLDYNQNHNFKLLDTLNQSQKNQIEFLCNAICPPGCPNRKEHYRLNGLFYLNFMKPYDLNYCGVQQHTLHPLVENYKNHINADDIYTTYVDKGFSMFKLEGRTLPTVEVMLNCAKYLIKPEYQLFFITEMLSSGCCGQIK